MITDAMRVEAERDALRLSLKGAATALEESKAENARLREALTTLIDEAHGPFGGDGATSYWRVYPDAVNAARKALEPFVARVGETKAESPPIPSPLAAAPVMPKGARRVDGCPVCDDSASVLRVCGNCLGLEGDHVDSHPHVAEGCHGFKLPDGWKPDHDASGSMP